MKIAITDLECTGLKPKIHEIIEIGFIVFDDKDFKIIKSMNIKVKPKHPETGTEEAFKINGYNKKDWKDAYSLKDAIKLYNAYSEGCIFCAHNMIFDYGFLKEAYDKLKIVPSFDYHKLDIYTIAFSKISHDKLKKWSLKSICEYLKIEPEPEIHRAINGATCEFEIYKKLMK